MHKSMVALSSLLVGLAACDLQPSLTSLGPGEELIHSLLSHEVKDIGKARVEEAKGVLRARFTEIKKDLALKQGQTPTQGRLRQLARLLNHYFVRSQGKRSWSLSDSIIDKVDCDTGSVIFGALLLEIFGASAFDRLHLIFLPEQGHAMLQIALNGKEPFWFDWTRIASSPILSHVLPTTPKEAVRGFFGDKATRGVFLERADARAYKQELKAGRYEIIPFEPGALGAWTLFNLAFVVRKNATTAAARTRQGELFSAAVALAKKKATPLAMYYIRLGAWSLDSENPEEVQKSSGFFRKARALGPQFELLGYFLQIKAMLKPRITFPKYEKMIRTLAAAIQENTLQPDLLLYTIWLHCQAEDLIGTPAMTRGVIRTLETAAVNQPVLFKMALSSKGLIFFDQEYQDWISENFEIALLNTYPFLVK